MEQAAQSRWLRAQTSEQTVWQNMTISELLRICAEKPAFLQVLGEAVISDALDGREVLEIGVGPLGISLASFYPHKAAIRRLVKVEPLPLIDMKQTSLATEYWATPFVQWAEALASEGTYVQMSAEATSYREEFDTVLVYNVLDHVGDPEGVLRAAYAALRPRGRIIVGVDCFSVLGRLRFELITRRQLRGTVLVDAHPHSFDTDGPLRLMARCGFSGLQMLGAPNRIRLWLGSHSRPAFIGVKTGLTPGSTSRN